MKITYEPQRIIANTLTLLGKEILNSDKRTKTTFNLLADCCEFKELPEDLRCYRHKSFCKNPDLKDPNFGWLCNMGNCPYINKAI